MPEQYQFELVAKAMAAKAGPAAVRKVLHARARAVRAVWRRAARPEEPMALVLPEQSLVPEQVQPQWGKAEQERHARLELVPEVP